MLVKLLALAIRSTRLSILGVVGLALVGCLAASACSGSDDASNTSKPQESNTGANASAPAYARKLQPKIEEQMHARDIPGALIYVDVPGEGTWSAALGKAKLAIDDPMEFDDHFRVGSITKTFTGTVILQLVDEGKLRLDDPVSKYQPEVPNGKNITIRETLNMSSGLFSYSEDKGFNQTLDSDPHKVWEPEELVSIGLRHKPVFPPGKGFYYSNTNFVLLGMIVEELTGQPLEEAYEERIFEPLRMTQTSLPERTSAAIPAPHAQGYMYGTNVEAMELSMLTGKKAAEANESAGKPSDVTGHNPSWAWAAGGAISTVHDLKIYAKALATGELLSPQTQKQRLTWSPHRPAPDAKYGLAVAQIAGSYIGHDGQLPGFNSLVAYDPQRKITVVFNSNLYASPDGSTPATVIPKLIIEELSGAGTGGKSQ